MPPARITVLATLAALGVSCGSGTLPAIDAAMAARVPPSATILAGVNLQRVRASPLYRQLPPAALAFMEALAGARSVLAASDGGNYLILTRGEFRQAPPGATLLAPGLSAAGSPGWVDAATSRYGVTNSMLARAEPLAANAEIWMAAAGSANLPLSGNGENLNGLLHETEYTTLTVRLADQVAIEAIGMCRGPESARHLEETVRTFVTLGAAATKREPALSGLLRRIRVSSDNGAVHVTLVAQAGDLGELFRVF